MAGGFLFLREGMTSGSGSSLSTPASCTSRSALEGLTSQSSAPWRECTSLERTRMARWASRDRKGGNPHRARGVGVALGLGEARRGDSSS